MDTTIHGSLDARAQSGAMDDGTDSDPEVPERARGPRRYSAKYKAQILEEFERLDKAGKGALLRREGLCRRSSKPALSAHRKSRLRACSVGQASDVSMAAPVGR